MTATQKATGKTTSASVTIKIPAATGGSPQSGNGTGTGTGSGSGGTSGGGGSVCPVFEPSWPSCSVYFSATDYSQQLAAFVPLGLKTCNQADGGAQAACAAQNQPILNSEQNWHQYCQYGCDKSGVNTPSSTLTAPPTSLNLGACATPPIIGWDNVVAKECASGVPDNLTCNADGSACNWTCDGMVGGVPNGVNIPCNGTRGPKPSGATIGDMGAQVDAIQQYLIQQGLLNIDAPTGYFGPLTEAAVIAFQKAHGLPQSGIVDQATLAAMGL